MHALTHIGSSPSESLGTPSDRPFPRGRGRARLPDVAIADAAGSAAFVGRAQERERVRSILRGARDGQMAALLVSGDAGIGKTRLVRHVCADGAADAGLLVMSGVCLPMGATTVPLMPLRTAVRRLPEGVPAPDLDDVVHRGGAPVAVDAWLDRICRDRAVVLVVDDVQWADEPSLDVLTYLLAGPPDRSLGLLLTLRSDE
ncbi:MAG TPA: ATP-binding protein, partial [Ornithinibacter sp.]|nr:ATP-binding protein [Ornithinibacter sp.]